MDDDDISNKIAQAPGPATLVDAEVYGALKEGVHLAGYSLERAFAGLKHLLAEDRWWGLGFTEVDTFLDSIRLDNFRILARTRARRPRLVRDPAVARAIAAAADAHSREPPALIRTSTGDHDDPICESAS
jgi:hypothetical protein